MRSQHSQSARNFWMLGPSADALLAELSANLGLCAARHREKMERSKFVRISRGVIIQSKFLGLMNVLLVLMGFSLKCLLGTDSLPQKHS